MLRKALGAWAAVFSLALPAVAAAAPTVIIDSPAAGSAADTSVSVSVRATSGSYSISSVTAKVGSTSIPLTFGWSGSVPLADVPIGPTTLTVTASDAVGATGTSQVEIIHDGTPTTNVTAPIEGTVARPELALDAACVDTDAYGCANVAVYADNTSGTPLASGVDGIHQSLSLSAFEGKKVDLKFVSTDTKGLKSTVTRTVYVDSSPTLTEIASVGGPIYDVDASSILFQSPSGIALRTRAAGTDQVLSPDATTAGYLTPFGAIWPEGEWKNGTRVWTGPARIALRVAGAYALWANTTSGPCMYRDLAAGADTVLWNQGTCIVNDVAANGDAIWNKYATTERYRGGTSSVLGTHWYYGAVTDGASVVACQHNLEGNCPGMNLIDATGTESPLPGVSGSKMCFPGTCYSINNGWIAYGATNTPSGDIAIYRRSPAGVTAMVSVWTGDTAIDTLAPNGELTMTNAGGLLNQPGRRSLKRATGIPVDVSASLGRAIFLGGAWYVAMGRSLFAVTDGGDGGAPVVDPAGPGSDAGDAGAAEGEAGTDAGGSADSDGSPMPSDSAASGPENSAPGPTNAGGDASATPAGGVNSDNGDSSGCNVGDGTLGSGAMLPWLPLGVVVLARIRRRRAAPRRRVVSPSSRP